MPFEHYSFIAGALCQTGDRYLRSGYKEQTLTVPQVLRAVAARGIATGVEIHHRGTEDEAYTDELLCTLTDTRLQPTFVNTWTYGERQWRFGSLSAADADTRREAVRRVRETVDFARTLGALGVSLWLGQDGFDYAFQTDYRAQWQHLVDSLREICGGVGSAPVISTAEGSARAPFPEASLIEVVTPLIFIPDGEPGAVFPDKNVPATVITGVLPSVIVTSIEPDCVIVGFVPIESPRTGSTKIEGVGLLTVILRENLTLNWSP